MALRQVRDLVWAKPSDAVHPVSRPRGAKAFGTRYERALGRGLPYAVRGQWWRFEDGNGYGACQTDFLFSVGRIIVVLEAKYRWTFEGHQQLEALYQPVVRAALERDVVGIVVCKILASGMKGLALTGSMRDAVGLALRGSRVVLHWIGQSAAALGLAGAERLEL